MQRHHSFIIPSKDDLAVRFETLHSVIVREAQCICCGSVQGSFHAAKQHMLHNGYWRIDIFKGSAFRESCDFD
ncbi:TRI15 protein [Colletotrichum chrysophilum]|uniref:TRI15 protein n=1 Tax=Colletotrichum chrysophilum TaxID=1836956 RepID=A0AAD9EK02_9PEZI|nr:TRI15 protein [Colletotrichum chrysophilum]